MMRRAMVSVGAAAFLLVAASPAPADFLAKCDTGLSTDPRATKPVRDFLCACYQQAAVATADPTMEDRLIKVIEAPMGGLRGDAVMADPATYPIFRNCSTRLLEEGTRPRP